MSSAATQITDSHVHFWNPDTYSWLTPSEPQWLNRAHLLEPQRRAAGVTEGVDARASHDPRESAWALGLADAAEWIGGAVGWLDLNSDSLERACLKFDAPLRFAASYPAAVSVLAAARSVEQLEDNAAIFSTAISPELSADLRASTRSTDLLRVTRELQKAILLYSRFAVLHAGEHEVRPYETCAIALENHRHSIT